VRLSSLNLTPLEVVAVTTRHTQPLFHERAAGASRQTQPATRATIDSGDKLNAVVMAFNVRQGGREYAMSETGALFDAVKQFNTRRLNARAY
jgi:hypothetical protein